MVGGHIPKPTKPETKSYTPVLLKPTSTQTEPPNDKICREVALFPRDPLGDHFGFGDPNPQIKLNTFVLRNWYLKFRAKPRET